jgi:hypothetical protein
MISSFTLDVSGPFTGTFPKRTRPLVGAVACSARLGFLPTHSHKPTLTLHCNCSPTPPPRIPKCPISEVVILRPSDKDGRRTSTHHGRRIVDLEQSLPALCSYVGAALSRPSWVVLSSVGMAFRGRPPTQQVRHPHPLRNLPPAQIKPSLDTPAPLTMTC